MSKKKNPKRQVGGTARRFRAAREHEHAGRFAQAERCYRQILKTDPEDVHVLYNLGNTLARQEKLEQAQEAYERAAVVAPEMAAVQLNLGNAHYLRGQYKNALAAYRKVLALEPDNADIHINLANVFRRLQDWQQVIASLRQALAVNPHHPHRSHIQNNLGNILLKHRRYDQAAAVFRQAVAQDPHNATAGHMLAAVTGVNPKIAPAAYVAETFDELADRFDRHLVQGLGYAVPQKLREALRRMDGKDRRYERLLDLGCGTGLCGQTFQDLVRNLSGIDLSRRMLAAARKKNIYGTLMHGGITEALNNSDATYDLFVAADVFPYIGDLQPLFTAVKRCARAEARFLFSTESHGDPGYRLRPTGRYAHALFYIRQLARECGFAVGCQRPVKVRREKKEWIEGDLFVLTM